MATATRKTIAISGSPPQPSSRQPARAATTATNPPQCSRKSSRAPAPRPPSRSRTTQRFALAEALCSISWHPLMQAAAQTVHEAKKGGDSMWSVHGSDYLWGVDVRASFVDIERDPRCPAKHLRRRRSAKARLRHPDHRLDPSLGIEQPRSKAGFARAEPNVPIHDHDAGNGI